MKRIIFALVIFSTLGAGCSPTTSKVQQAVTNPPNLNATAGAESVNSITAKNFDFKLKCQPLIDKYKKEIEAESPDNMLMEFFWYGCYSKKYNTCIAFIQRNMNSNSETNRKVQYLAIDLLTMDTFTLVDLTSGTKNDPSNTTVDLQRMGSLDDSMGCLK
ncbi:hypothetical protein HZC53_00910 [Candidatus Uhrbacteria bacterium]|nr:hypothetical protein [Candidatus Uhrbacteria bacterium]